MLDRGARIKAQHVVAVEQRGHAVHSRAFDCEHTKLCCDAALRRETADLAAGCEHAMTRYHDRERVSSESLADGARRAAGVEPRRNIAIGERLPGRDAARDLEDPAVKRRYTIHVERYGGEIARLPVQQRNNVVDCALHLGWRQGFTRQRETMEHARAGLELARLGELETDDAALPPRDAAPTNRRIEERKATCCHVAIVPPTPAVALGESCFRGVC